MEVYCSTIGQFIIPISPRTPNERAPRVSVSLKCPRTDISPRYDELTNGRAVNQTQVLISPRYDELTNGRAVNHT